MQATLLSPSTRSSSVNIDGANIQVLTDAHTTHTSHTAHATHTRECLTPDNFMQVTFQIAPATRSSSLNTDGAYILVLTYARIRHIQRIQHMQNIPGSA